MRPRTAVLVMTLAVAAAAACDARGGGARRGARVPLDSAGLAVMIDSLVPVISRTSGLPVRHPVAYRLQSRADARVFIDAQLDEELGPEVLHGTERVYRALGLIPDTLDLRETLLALYTEQVIGYYDPKTDRLYVLEGVPADSAAPVVAHELVHALQDQYTDLDSLVAPDRGNDRQMAAQAAAEGQATLVMVAIQTAELTGKPADPGDLPDMRDVMGPALESQNDQFPVFQRAPRIIKETLLFPYLGGAVFVQALFRHRQGDAIPIPFRDLLPQSTEQVMRPLDRFLDTRDPPSELTLGAAADGWRVAYTNTFGEMETSVILSEYLGEHADSAITARGAGTARSAGFARGWDGDRYALLDGPAGAQALVWYSVWDDVASADRFAADYRRVLAKRPGRTGGVERLEVDGRPVARVVETAASAGVPLIDIPVPSLVGIDQPGP